MELIYTAYAQNPSEIIEAVYSDFSFFLILLPVFFIVSIATNNEEEEDYSKYIFVIAFIFFSLLIFAEHYSLTNLSSSLKRALSNSNNSKYIEGTVQEYTYRNSIKRELFSIKGIRFNIQNNSNPISKNYPKLISNKQLKLKIEYIPFPKYNTTIVRAWKL